MYFWSPHILLAYTWLLLRVLPGKAADTQPTQSTSCGLLKFLWSPCMNSDAWSRHESIRASKRPLSVVFVVVGTTTAVFLALPLSSPSFIGVSRAHSALLPPRDSIDECSGVRVMRKMIIVIMRTSRLADSRLYPHTAHKSRGMGM